MTISTRAASLLGLGQKSPAENAATDDLVGKAAYFSLFSRPNPASPTIGNPLIQAVGQALSISFDVSEKIHRFEVDELEPTPACGLRLSQNLSSNGVATVSLQMTPMAGYFQAAPDRTPAPTVLLPIISQRFVPLDGAINFDDAAGSGIKAAGAGRIYPTPGGLQPRLGAVIDSVEGFGALAGKAVTGIIMGSIVPPASFAFNVQFRVVDPDGQLEARVPPGPLEGPSDPTPQTQTEMGTTFMSFLAEPDPSQPITVEDGPGQNQVRITITERLRLVAVSFNVDAPGLRSRTVPGAVVGGHRTQLTVTTEGPGDVLPAFSTGDEFWFFDDRNRSIGGFEADTIEARILPTTEGGASMLRVGGIALPTKGRGQFTEPVGMVSINGAFSPATGAISTLYVVRLTVPDAVFKIVESLNRKAS